MEKGGGGRGQPVEERATGERATASQLWVNHSFYFSVRSQEGGRVEGRGGEVGGEQLALPRPQGKESWLLGTGSDFCGRELERVWLRRVSWASVCAYLWTFMRRRLWLSVRRGSAHSCLWERVRLCVCVFACVMSTDAEQHQCNHHCCVCSAGMINEPVWYLCCRPWEIRGLELSCHPYPSLFSLPLSPHLAFPPLPPPHPSFSLLASQACVIYEEFTLSLYECA